MRDETLDLLETLIDNLNAEELKEASQYLLDAALKRHEGSKVSK